MTIEDLRALLPRWAVWISASGAWKAWRHYHGSKFQISAYTPELLINACQHLDRVDP